MHMILVLQKKRIEKLIQTVSSNKQIFLDKLVKLQYLLQYINMFKKQQNSIQKDLVKTNQSILYVQSQEIHHQQLCAEIFPVFFQVNNWGKVIKKVLNNIRSHSNDQKQTNNIKFSHNAWKNNQLGVKQKIQQKLLESTVLLNADYKIKVPSLIFIILMIIYMTMFYLFAKTQINQTFYFMSAVIALILVVFYLAYSLKVISKIKREIVQQLQKINAEFCEYKLCLKKKQNKTEFYYNFVQVYKVS